MFIPMSLMATSQMEWQRKVMICGLFSLGIFVVICASLTKYFAFTSTTHVWVLWYVREASTAMLVGNIYLCLPLVRHIVGTSYKMVGSGRLSSTGSAPPMPEVVCHEFDKTSSAGHRRDPEN
ncbi:hypothetical protein BP6252_06409 [Coleophoma cylindrospora]|uniref:Uncharacterized protein n=1 Tax=Coleophoma cylindrospora TaxID=1849047 RepID=A0A3D8RMI4_9HELO|nr:hypothetical protein BP6252_06409 [Coleophoma cylindrospora]